ncbi:MAG: M20/M25/M40 family metallo-hydrolase, partial [Alcaligenes aquatilis]
KVAYGTEAGLFQQAGIPSIICGPGNIEQAHRPDEYVELAQVEQCEQFLRALIRSQAVTA